MCNLNQESNPCKVWSRHQKQQGVLHNHTHLLQHWHHQIFLVVFPFDLQQLSYSYFSTHSIHI